MRCSMQLRECEYILAIAEEGNMGKAAQRLYVSQPALSKMLTKLEESIGMPLFERQSSGMTPTRTGEAYIEGARRMLELNSQWEQEINSASGKHPSLYLGVPMLRLLPLTGYVLPRLAKQFPGLQVHYLITPQGKLLVDLLNNKCSLGIGIAGPKFSNILNCDMIGQEEFVLVVPKGHPLEKEASPKNGGHYPHIPTSLLKNVPFVLSRPDAYSTRLTLHFFNQNDLHPPIAITLHGTRDIINVVAGGGGVSLLPSQPLKAMGFEDRLTYLQVDTQEPPMQVCVMYRRGYTLSKAESAFVELLREAYRLD